jgi:MFS family permease
MANRYTLTLSLAIAGTVLTWLPILAPLFFSIALFTRARVFRLDYLMPAELFLVVLAGGFALLFAAIRARSRRKIIAWAFGIAVGGLIAGQLVASLTGLASGEADPSGWRWALVVASLALYSLSVVAMGVGGLLLLGDLFKQPPLPTQGT